MHYFATLCTRASLCCPPFVAQLVDALLPQAVKENAGQGQGKVVEKVKDKNKEKN